MAVADAQGFADAIDGSKVRRSMSSEELDLDNVKQKAFFPVLQKKLMTSSTRSMVLKYESSGCDQAVGYGLSVGHT